MSCFKAISLLVSMLALSITCFAAGGGEIVKADPDKHFDPKGKLPSEFTVEFQNGQRKSLPFEDKRDFDEAKQGFIAAPEYKQIMAEAGHVAWDMGSYEFLLTDKEYDTIHPSLQRSPSLRAKLAGSFSTRSLPKRPLLLP
jgi:alkyl sulfatase BDS1-like metallo-beta-lactamase superfamily hydrolase